MTSEAERRLAELQALLETRDPAAADIEVAGRRVAAALGTLTRAVPPDELARIADLHALVRATAAGRRDDSGTELERVREERSRLARLTRPNDGDRGLDVRA